MNVFVVQIRYHVMTHVTAHCRSDPGSVFMTSSMRHSTFPAQGINTMRKSLLLKKLFDFEDGGSKRHIHRVILTDREGESEDQVMYYPSQNYGLDSRSTFEANELLFFSNTLNLTESENSKNCNREADFDTNLWMQPLGYLRCAATLGEDCNCLRERVATPTSKITKQRLPKHYIQLVSQVF